MATRALFIGINEYSDINIDNLEGARLDAVALHSLFCDSVADIQAQLLVDRAATKSAVDVALHSVMQAASPEDLVIVTFSGHGSADDGLLLRDSSADPGSVFSMSELAVLFQQSPAGRILVLLDCCESGEGPRRVLKTWADTSSIDGPIHAPDGGGRTMIAAANPNQAAWESGVVDGHGLLTASLMQVLTTAESPVDVRVLSAAISERVRAEAARSGDQQTPVDLSIVAGSFYLPPLRAGDAYRKAFPSRVSSARAKTFGDLQNFGISPSIVTTWESSYPGGLNALQEVAINEKRLLDGQNLLVIAPTGSGKTLLGEMAAMRTVSAGRRAVFLVPLRALAAEKHTEFLTRYHDALGLRVIRCTGDYTDNVTEFLHGKYDVAILTYEMFLSLALVRSSSLVHLGAVIVDEAHFITDPERGIVVELLLTLLVSARRDGVAAHLVALSAVIGDVNHFDEWMGAGCLQHLERPIPLVEGVIDRSGTFQYVDADGTDCQEQLVPRHLIYQRRDKPSPQDVIVPLVQQLLKDDKETVLVFRGIRGKAAGTANYIADSLSLPPATAALQGLPAVASSTDSAQLRKCLQRGTAFHSSNLVREERAVVEGAFRDAREVRVLASTTTLAAGVNTPASTVIIVEHDFPGDPPRNFRVAEYKNMAGRAGRPGFGPVGRSILYADNAIERARLFATYVRGVPEGVNSSFNPRKIDTWLIRLLRQVRRIEEQRVVALLANTFGGYTLARQDPSWQGRTERELLGILGRMKALGLVEEFRGYLVLTRLGEACGQASLSLQSCLHLVEMLKHSGVVAASELMVLVQCLDELDAVYTPLAKANKKGTDRRWSYETAGTASRSTLGALARGAGDDGYERRCKRALVLTSWIAGTPMVAIEERFSPHPFFRVTSGTVRSFAETTRFHLRSAADIAKVVFHSPEYSEGDVQMLLHRLELGVTEPMLALAELARTLTREELLRLFSVGFRTKEALAGADDEVLKGILGDGVRLAALRAVVPEAGAS